MKAQSGHESHDRPISTANNEFIRFGIFRSGPSYATRSIRSIGAFYSITYTSSPSFAHSRLRWLPNGASAQTQILYSDKLLLCSIINFYWVKFNVAIAVINIQKPFRVSIYIQFRRTFFPTTNICPLLLFGYRNHIAHQQWKIWNHQSSRSNNENLYRVQEFRRIECKIETTPHFPFRISHIRIIYRLRIIKSRRKHSVCGAEFHCNLQIFEQLDDTRLTHSFFSSFYRWIAQPRKTKSTELTYGRN